MIMKKDSKTGVRSQKSEEKAFSFPIRPLDRVNVVNTPRPFGTPLSRGDLKAVRQSRPPLLLSPLSRGDTGVCMGYSQIATQCRKQIPKILFLFTNKSVYCFSRGLIRHTASQ